MHNITKTLLALFVFCAFSLFALPSPVFAADNNELGNEFACNISINGTLASIDNGNAPVAYPIRELSNNDFSWGNIRVNLSNAAAERYEECGGELKIAINHTTEFLGGWNQYPVTLLSPYQTVDEWIVKKNPNTSSTYNYQLDVEIRPSSGSRCPNDEPICKRVYINISSSQLETPGKSCKDAITAYRAVLSDFPTNMVYGQQTSFSLPDFEALRSACRANLITADIVRTSSQTNVAGNEIISSSPNGPILFTPPYVGQHVFRLGVYQELNNGTNPRPILDFTKNFCVVGTSEETCVPNGGEVTPTEQGPFNLCKQIPIITDEQVAAVVREGQSWIDKLQLLRQTTQRRDRLIREKRQCCECAGGQYDTAANECNIPDGEDTIDPANQGIYTAIGCIPSNSESIVAQMVKIGLGIAGGIALLMILAGSFMLSTSQGEPKRAGEAKELITSAVMGLLFVIFSVTILQFIGVTILRIPGFGSR